ncbi:MAG: PadR family transcriptional regulator [Rectinemataceae bacterium]
MSAGNAALSPSVEFSLLGLLREHPMHGYALYRTLGRKSGVGLAWSVKRSQLYAILASLEAQGLIEGEIPAGAAMPVSGVSGAATLPELSNGPPRKVFRTTPKGLSAFREWVSSPVARGNMRVEFHAKLHFALAESDTAAGALVAAQRELCADWIDDMRSRRAHAAQSASAVATAQVVPAAQAMPAVPVAHLALAQGDDLIYAYRIGQLEATLAWLDRCARVIGASGGAS